MEALFLGRKSSKKNEVDEDDDKKPAFKDIQVETAFFNWNFK